MYDMSNTNLTLPVVTMSSNKSNVTVEQPL